MSLLKYGRVATDKDRRSMAGRCSNAKLTVNGHLVSNIHMEQAYKGNYHLLAVVDGKERKFVIGKNKEEFSLIEKTGVANLTPEQLHAMAEKYCFS